MSLGDLHGCHEMTLMEREVSHSQRQVLIDKLIELRTSLLVTTPALRLYLSQDVSCGLPLAVVDTIVANCHAIHCVEDLEEQCSTWHLSDRIMQIIDDVLS